MRPPRTTLLSVFPPEEWRSTLRSLLRECSYLPDPVARATCHDQVLRRFRRYHEEQRGHIRNDAERLSKLRKEARLNLSVLRRANEGFSRPLERVLRFAYGRSGRRRIEMLKKLLRAESPTNSEAVEALIAAPAQFAEGWVPPKVMADLLKSQNSNPLVEQIRGRSPRVKKLEPPVSVKNSWGRNMPLVRKKNIRRRWYNSVFDVLLPPLPEAELQVLDGLISGDILFKPPKRRSKQLTTSPANASNVNPRGGMIRKILTDGPPKEQTFAAYVNGRPHNITRRFMCRLWQRISCLAPRHHWDAAQKKHIFGWDTAKFQQKVAISAKEGSSQEIFGGLEIDSDTRNEPGKAKSSS
ncbi:hypothetical protein BDW62DRAFT_149765 [Aspergillus aurantiobrunneus]